MPEPRNRNNLEKFLNLFTEIKAGEGINSILLALNIFLILTSYYIIKPVREALILQGGGAELKSYMAAGQAILLLLAIPVFSRLAALWPRRKLIPCVTFFFVGCLLMFYTLAQFKVPLGAVFFLWVGIFNLMVPALFWSFANDLYTPETGKRIFVIVAFGASLGAVLGARIAGLLIEPLGVYQLMLVAGGLLLIALILTNFIDTKERNRLQQRATPESPFKIGEPLAKGNAFKLVFNNKYLLLIAFLMLFLNWVNTTGEYILGRTVSAAAIKAIETGTIGGLTEGQFIGKFYADFYYFVNIAGLVLQLFVVSRILKYGGVRLAIFILPFIALGGYFAIAFFPVLSIIRWVKTAENATDYSLQNTVRQVLFLPTTREQKYKAKQVIDTFFWRSGDVLSAVLVYLGKTYFSFQTKQFALFNLGLIMLWMTLAFFIGKENQKLTAQASKM